MQRVFELKDGTFIYCKDVKKLIINGKEEVYDSHKKLLDAVKQTQTVGAILIDDTEITPGDIKRFIIE
ncbi:hypothetical protein [Clostridium sp. C2-6-12]|uniref:hypothetical protein n=1 Tax=Clostridium sp. C2-6-12 TaxID=2698832 RepID=UPI00136E1D20|nr:hypothetical protein [Clostridium sp. C2-6-12]